jgi:hypothetical protein
LEWKRLALDFGSRWNFPNCIGAIDGKHIRIVKPPNSGSLYFNYKKTFSIVLLAVVNANYQFIMVDVGTNGRVPDGGVFASTSFLRMLEEKRANIPASDVLPNSSDKHHFVFVGDEAFPLKEYLMKPYNQRDLNTDRRIYNYRLSRARRVVENAFGILASRFRILLTDIHLSPDKVKIIVLACCHLHNYLREQRDQKYINWGSMDYDDTNTGLISEGEWRSDCEAMIPLQPTQHHNAAVSAKNIRNKYCAYFNNEGAVPWQNKVLQ